MNTLTTTSQIDRFIECIQRGIEAWKEAGEIARVELADDPYWADKVAEKNRIITSQAVHRFAAIGVKFIPQLAIDECPGAKRLRQLPLSIQETNYHNPIGLLIQNNSEWEELKVDLHNLTSDQAAQVFATDHVRTSGEQRAWIEDRKSKQDVTIPKQNPPYRIVGNSLVVMSPCKFTRKELSQILANME